MLNSSELTEAVARLQAIAFFPTDPGARFAVGAALRKFVRGPRELDWLVTTAVNYMGTWLGTAQLRALYCTRFTPVDGTDGTDGPHCEVPGFTPADSERKYIEEGGEERDQRRLGGRLRRIGEIPPPRGLQ